MLFLTAIPAVLQEFLAALPIQVQGKSSKLPNDLYWLTFTNGSPNCTSLWSLAFIGLVIAAVLPSDNTTFVEDPRFWKRLTRKTRRRLAKRLARIGTGLASSVHPQSQSDAQWLAHELADVMRVAHWTATVLETSYGGMRVKMESSSANQNHVEAAKQLVDSLHSIEISAVFDPNTDIVRESDLRITIGSRPEPCPKGVSVVKGRLGLPLARSVDQLKNQFASLFFLSGVKAPGAMTFARRPAIPFGSTPRIIDPSSSSQ